jgi:hypothetical protein
MDTRQDIQDIAGEDPTHGSRRRPLAPVARSTSARSLPCKARCRDAWREATDTPLSMCHRTPPSPATTKSPPDRADQRPALRWWRPSYPTISSAIAPASGLRPLRRRGDRAALVRPAPCRTIGIARAVRMGAGTRAAAFVRKQQRQHRSMTAARLPLLRGSGSDRRTTRRTSLSSI